MNGGMGSIEGSGELPLAAAACGENDEGMGESWQCRSLMALVLGNKWLIERAFGDGTVKKEPCGSWIKRVVPDEGMVIVRELVFVGG
ncbi:hypothetical protein V6N13_061285 [Hibiscus sabdariffa]|uniref:Uncharacterized protein n=1 Tax=Hibiscus sabdariffa TaxID=183260 RepID=A0ABR2EFT0_9ROSI